MDLTTLVIALSGAGAVVAIAMGLRQSRSQSQVPLPPLDPSAGERYGLLELPEPPQPEQQLREPDLDHGFAGAGPSGTEQMGLGAVEDTWSIGQSPTALPPRSGRRTTSRAARRRPGWDKTGMRDLAIGAGGLLSAPIPVMLGARWEVSAAVGGVAALVGLWFGRRGLTRQRGVAVERAAVRSVRLPEGWASESGVPVAGLGDADLVITDPEGVRFIVEIKSHEAVQVRKPWFGSTAKLVGTDGKPLTKDPVAQALALAGILHGYPVVWFPKSRRAAVARVGDPEVLVVQGPWRHLRKAIGAGGGWFG